MKFFRYYLEKDGDQFEVLIPTDTLLEIECLMGVGLISTTNNAAAIYGQITHKNIYGEIIKVNAKMFHDEYIALLNG